MNIPEELKELNQWVCWKKALAPDGKSIKKIPIDPKTGQAAAANNPDTWTDYETAAAEANKYDGIGFEFIKGGGIFGIDLDHVIKDGVINPIAKEIIESIDSYTELSPSGQGVHILAKGSIPDKDRRKDFIEMYSDGRYFTVTGNIYDGRDRLNERTAQAAAIHAKYIKRPDAQTPQDPQPGNKPDHLNCSDIEALQKARNGKNGARFSTLWQGDISLYDNDHSAADLALITDLGYWTNYDPGQMDRLFRQSGLMRPKWDKKHGSETYGQMTINRVLSTKAIIPSYQEDEALQELQYFEELKKAKTANASPDPAAPTPPVDTNTALGSQSSEKEYYRLVYSAAGSMGALDQMITSTANTPGIPTGFSEFDSLLDGGLYPGLIIIGAVTSVGKTAVCLQIMDQIAKAGQDVMIFSLEMSKFELMARSISRESFLNDVNNALTIRDILDGKRLDKFSIDKLSNYSKSKDFYKEYANKIFIHEGLGNIRTDSIGTKNDKRLSVRDKVENHIKVTGNSPVVLIDYIQLLASKDPRMTDKQAVDYNVMALKQISRDCHIPVIGISSLNRASYSTRNNNGNGSSSGNNNSGSNSKVALESFKESGAIEYSSDILIGFNRTFDDKNGKSEMELDILKNRNGKKDVFTELEYYYMYNCFIEKRKPKFTTKKPNAI